MHVFIMYFLVPQGALKTQSITFVITHFLSRGQEVNSIKLDLDMMLISCSPCRQEGT